MTTEYPTKCPCDSCKFKKLNYMPPNECPNFEHFFDVMSSAFEGKLNTDECACWEQDVKE